MRKIILVVAALAGAFVSLPAAAKETRSGALSLLFENDLFFNTDRHYTNGVALNYTTAPQDTPRWVTALAHDLPMFGGDGEVRTSYEVGQDMFTPQNTALAIPDPNDRPYAGYLYLGLGLLEKDETHLDQIQLQLGVVGPAALAKETQFWIHGILGDPKPAGWAFQLHNEPAVEVIYERSFKLVPPKSFLGLFFDVEPHAGAAVGTVYDYVNAGAMARLGFNLPDDFGPMRLEPSLPGSGFFEPNGDLSIYVFAGADGRAVGRNIFLDGNSWQASRGVDKNIFVGDLQFGAAIAFEGWRLSFTHVFRTKEFHNQGAGDQFGAVALTARL